MPTGYDGEEYTDADVVALRAALGLTDTAKPKKDAGAAVAPQQRTPSRGDSDEKNS